MCVVLIAAVKLQYTVEEALDYNRRCTLASYSLSYCTARSWERPSVLASLAVNTMKNRTQEAAEARTRQGPRLTIMREAAKSKVKIRCQRSTGQRGTGSKTGFQQGSPAGKDEPQSGSYPNKFRVWAGFADRGGSGRGGDGAAARPARAAARLLLPGGPRPAARRAGEQGELRAESPHRRSPQGAPSRNWLCHPLLWPFPGAFLTTPLWWWSSAQLSIPSVRFLSRTRYRATKSILV